MKTRVIVLQTAFSLVVVVCLLYGLYGIELPEEPKRPAASATPPTSDDVLERGDTYAMSTEAFIGSIRAMDFTGALSWLKDNASGHDKVQQITLPQRPRLGTQPKLLQAAEKGPEARRRMENQTQAY